MSTADASVAATKLPIVVAESNPFVADAPIFEFTGRHSLQEVTAHVYMLASRSR